MSFPLTTGAALPRKSQERWFMVYGVPGDSIMTCVIIGDAVQGQWTHYDGLTQPCTQTPECRRCKAGEPSRWQGYVAAWFPKTNKEFVLQLSEGGARHLLDNVATHGPLRGLHVEVKRQRKPNKRTVARNAPLIVKVIERVSEDVLPRSFDVVPSLHRFFGLTASARGSYSTDGTRSAPLPGASVRGFLDGITGGNVDG